MNPSNLSKLHTISDWINHAEKSFEAAHLTYGHGTDNAWDEAVQTVLFILGLPLDSDESILNQPVESTCAHKIQQLIEQRVNTRRPLPYLTHCAWFMGMPFYVDERVLIPRSPFGEWIERAFSPWIEADQVKNILDIGTGSGCLAIGCASIFPDASVDAVDISSEALSVAAKNVATYELQDRVHLIQSDCFNALPKKRYDVIISNPPYVGEEEMERLPAEYLHEPKLALVAENEGLAIAERIIKQASQYLTEQGILLIEVGYNAELLEKKYPRIPFTWLEQEHGGEGLFLLTKKELDDVR